MNRLMALTVLFSCLVLVGMTDAHPGDRRLDMEARVLDVLFPLDVAPNPYFLKMILRFGDSDTQLVIVVYPDKDKYWVRRGEVISYELADGKERFSELVSKIVAANPNVKPEEIAAKVRVNANPSPIDPEVLLRALDGLKRVRIPAMLADRATLDHASEYEYWYDNWQESVHYTLTGPFKTNRQDELVQWMISFRAKLPTLMKASLQQ